MNALGQIIQELRQFGAVKLTWSIVNDNDESHAVDEAAWGQGDDVNPLSIGADQFVFDIEDAIGGLDDGYYELDVTTKKLHRVGDAYIPEPDVVIDLFETPQEIEFYVEEEE